MTDDKFDIHKYSNKTDDKFDALIEKLDELKDKLNTLDENYNQLAASDSAKDKDLVSISEILKEKQNLSDEILKLEIELRNELFKKDLENSIDNVKNRYLGFAAGMALIFSFLGWFAADQFLIVRVGQIIEKDYKFEDINNRMEKLEDKDTEKILTGLILELDLQMRYLEETEFDFNKIRLPGFMVDQLKEMEYILKESEDNFSKENYKFHHYFYLGLLEYSRHKFERALKYFDEAIDRNRNAYFTHFLKGKIYHKQKKNEKELDSYNDAINVNNKFFRGYLARGHHYAKEGEFDLAFDDFVKAVKIRGSSGKAYNNRGWMYSIIKEEGNKQKAKEDYETALELLDEQQNTLILMNLAELHILNNEYDDAIIRIREAEEKESISKSWKSLAVLLECMAYKLNNNNEKEDYCKNEIEEINQNRLPLSDSWSFDTIKSWINEPENDINEDQKSYIENLISVFNELSDPGNMRVLKKPSPYEGNKFRNEGITNDYGYSLDLTWYCKVNHGQRSDARIIQGTQYWECYEGNIPEEQIDMRHACVRHYGDDVQVDIGIPGDAGTWFCY